MNLSIKMITIRLLETSELLVSKIIRSIDHVAISHSTIIIYLDVWMHEENQPVYTGSTAKIWEVCPTKQYEYLITQNKTRTNLVVAFGSFDFWER